MYEIFITNTTVEPFHWTTTRGSGLMKELNGIPLRSFTDEFCNSIAVDLILINDPVDLVHFSDFDHNIQTFMRIGGTIY